MTCLGNVTYTLHLSVLSIRYAVTLCVYCCLVHYSDLAQKLG